ncbi:hypothetical protein ACFV4P_05195 [Kitasatospora sp. NPDC059795]|uniref:hypothetical protein n=1 Tax=Kitasatospora sp. NPDC059795 TaxID=3346949 RepID=UPI00366858B9
MARLIVIIPLLLIVGIKLATWLMKRRVASLNARAEAAQATIDEYEKASRPVIYPTDHGMLHRDDLFVDPGLSGPDVDAALAAVKGGDWRPAAELLAAAAGDHDRRRGLLRRFAEPAAEDDAWLLAWRAEQPDSADAALLAQDGLIVLAWNVRTSKRAHQVTSERWAAFGKVLTDAEAAAAEAVRLADPADPLPFVLQIPLAMGQSWDNERFRALWQEIVSRDPHNFSAHTGALQYWCAKWKGSHEQMHAFADAAIAAAPAGSLLTALKLDAYFEQFTGEKEPYTSPEVRAAADAVVADLELADPDDRHRAYAHGWLVWVLAQSGRDADAMPHLRALGPIVPEPWTYWENPVDRFADRRVYIVTAATAQ